MILIMICLPLLTSLILVLIKKRLLNSSAKNSNDKNSSSEIITGIWVKGMLSRCKQIFEINIGSLLMDNIPILFSDDEND